MGDYGLFAEQLTTGHGYATGNCVWVRSLKNLFAEQGVSAAFSHSEHDQANPSVSVKLLAEGREADLVVWESGEGVFETVGNVLLGDGDVLDQHCFRRWNGKYFDECSNQLPGPMEPVGDFGLHSFRTIDDDISCLLYTSPSPRDRQKSRMPSSA